LHVTQSSLAIGSALRGEFEPIRQYGVLLDDATLRNRALKLGLIESAKLDAALIAVGQAPLFLPLYTEQRHMILTQLGGEPPHTPGDLRDRLTAAVSAFGDLADEVAGAKCPAGDGGAAITLAEAKALLTQADRLQAILTHLRRDVHAKCPAAANTGDRQ
jgi:hypothetical protein